MTIHQETIAKIEQLSDSLIQEVNDFVDWLLMKNDREPWQLWMQFTESSKLAGSNFSDYLTNLEDYEEKLARGEIKW